MYSLKLKSNVTLVVRNGDKALTIHGDKKYSQSQLKKWYNNGLEKFIDYEESTPNEDI